MALSIVTPSHTWAYNGFNNLKASANCSGVAVGFALFTFSLNFFCSRSTSNPSTERNNELTTNVSLMMLLSRSVVLVYLADTQPVSNRINRYFTRIALTFL